MILTEIEGVHIYSGEEWLAMPPEIQEYAKGRLASCCLHFADSLGMVVCEDVAYRVELDEVLRRVTVRCIRWLEY